MGAGTNTLGGVISLASTLIVAVVTTLFAPATAQAQSELLFNEVAKLLASDGQALDSFGVSVAVSGDTAVIGAHHDDDACANDPHCDSGAAYVFVRDANGAWTQQAKLLASDAAAGDEFGLSVAINGDTAVIGAYKDDDNGTDSGSAYVFVRDAAGVWTQQAKLLPSDGAGQDRFGVSVAINGDTAIIGAFSDNDNGFDSGSAYIFARDAVGVWTQQSKLLASDGVAGDEFGYSVALSGDTAVVGASQAEGIVLYVNVGAAYVFVRDASDAWAQQTKLLASDGAGDDGFGFCVALSGDTAVVGASGDDDNGQQSGSAYVFVRDVNCVWAQQAKLLPADGATSDQFGLSVAISGETVVVGAVRGDGDTIVDTGSAYVFVRDDTGVWSQRVKFLASDGAFNDFFGGAVAVTGDTAVVGAHCDSDHGVCSGSAYVFNLSPGAFADLSGDGVVDGVDLAILLTQWGQSGGLADINNDGVVNGVDLAILLTNWGPV